MAFDHLFSAGRRFTAKDRAVIENQPPAAAPAAPENPAPVAAQRSTAPDGRARKALSGGSGPAGTTAQAGELKEDVLGRSTERGEAKIAPEYRKALEEYYKALNR